MVCSHNPVGFEHEISDQFLRRLTRLLAQIVSLAFYGFQKALREGKDIIFALTYASLAVVGIGSICFHVTLRYSMQLGASDNPIIPDS